MKSDPPLVAPTAVRPGENAPGSEAVPATSVREEYNVKEEFNDTPQPSVGERRAPDPALLALPPAHAPPSAPRIDPTEPGILPDQTSVFDVDMNNLAEKGWRKPGSDLSDWFNYGFDEISWEAYCVRRRELGEAAAMLKGAVLVRSSGAGLVDYRLTDSVGLITEFGSDARGTDSTYTS